jgi:hypothetical protein
VRGDPLWASIPQNSIEFLSSGSTRTVIAVPGVRLSRTLACIDCVNVVAYASPPAGVTSTSNAISLPPPMSVFPVSLIDLMVAGVFTPELLSFTARSR